MIQGSRMTRGHRGMRSGISLVEMLIAIVLFGLISSIGYTYYKNFYDVSLAGKQTRVAAIIDQATQISNAFDLYTIKTGSEPTTIADLSAVNVKILTETPPPMTEITAAGWAISNTLDLDGSNNDVGLVYEIDAVGITLDEEREYCNILNNIAKSSWSLEAPYAAATAGSIGTNTDMYATATNNFKNMFCGGAAAGTLSFTFVKTVNP